nr:hypothetical protein [Gemmatimonadales bacterium]
MKRSFVRLAAAVGGLAVWTAPLLAQGYQVRLDTWFQSVAYRGWQLDSVPFDSVSTGATGGYEFNGFAVNCGQGTTTECYYYTAGDEQQGAPLVSTLDAALWGLGVRGLSFRLKARAGADLADPDVWPAVKPEAQLLEAYGEYENRFLTVVLGRFHQVTRLGYIGVDGGEVDLRLFDRKLELFGYGGWGLAPGAPLLVSSEWANPLDQFQPPQRQYVLGGGLGWRLSGFEGRWLYHREIDASSDANYLFAERTALDLAWYPKRGFSVTGGLEYDIGQDVIGTADVTLGYTTPKRNIRASLGARRYRPNFPLWLIWNSFSPVGYTAGFGSIYWWPIGGLELRGLGEIFSYGDAEATERYGEVSDDGWRGQFGVTYSGIAQWRFDGNYWVENGTGSTQLGVDLRATWEAPIDDLVITAHGGYLTRPLEYRYNDIQGWNGALRVDYMPMADVRFMGEARYYWEDRRRPENDAAAFDWNQWRINLGLTLYFGSSPDTPTLHPSILLIPEARSA